MHYVCTVFKEGFLHVFILKALFFFSPCKRDASDRGCHLFLIICTITL